MLTALALALVSAHAQSVESFYRGRTVTIVVGYSVGGGYDVLARVLAISASTLRATPRS